LRINKWGTVASAATAVVGIATSARLTTLQLTFDHPFIFLIRDTKTGAILFESVIDNPTAG
jgi:serpin B